MAIKSFWEQVLKKCTNDDAKKVDPAVETGVNERKTESTQHNYGMGTANFVLASGDYGWTEPNPKRKVVLVNPKDCERKITVSGLASAWRGTGHSEWEFLLAGLFVEAVLKALKEGDNTVDISCLFDRDFLASRDRKFTQDQVFNHLMKTFDIVEQSGDEFKVKLRIV